MLPLGTQAPDFQLPATDGQIVRLTELAGAPALLVMFICNHCPYVKHVADELARVGDQYTTKGVKIVAINSNDTDAYPDDNLEAMQREVVSRNYRFPYLLDADQAVAQAYRAACTPDFFLFDGEQKLVYRGQLDASRPGSDIPVTGSDLRAALDAVLAGTAPVAPQQPSLGCNIKWRPGNEPDYFAS
jgi:peroxiredoxin